MDTHTLQLFVDVVKLGSFAAVARQQNLDPSSVSRSVGALEDELKLRLLQRSTRQVSLTEAGALYFERIQPLLEEMRQAGQAAADFSSQPRGTLRVTASNAFGLKRVVPLLPPFRESYPELVVDLMLTDTIVDMLAERMDLAIRLGTLPDSNLVAQPLVRTHYLVCASPGYLQKHGRPTQPAQVSDHDCLLFPLPGFRSRWLFRDQQGMVSEVAVSGRALISNGLGLQHCASAGMGLALLADWQVATDLESGALVNLFPDLEVTATTFDTGAWFVYPSRSYVPLKLRVFMDFVRSAM
ncbi:LysR family transcriptional regulator [Aquabacterium sp.]|uniref:LysR family transcriptional regulator n=1 Tax=Aquabacterium sp. TaxID=1872578 RepID=UPI003D6D480D